MTYAQTLKLYEDANQGHVFKFWNQITEAEQQTLLNQLEHLDINRVNRIYAKAVAGEEALSESTGQDIIEPLPEDATDSVKQHPDSEQEWRQIGLKAIWCNQVGVLLMAGGQGTRLGSSAPKGCYDIGLPSHKTLFQYQAERVAGLQNVANAAREKARKEGQDVPTGEVIIPWYVMTSGPTRRETEQFFKSNNFFGLKPDNVIIFEQGTLPCLTMEGKIMLESKSHVAVAPEGNGGLYAALRQPFSDTDSNTVLKDLAKRGISYIHAYCVDNCLVKIADPVFIGYCIHKQADCAAKVVPKAHPNESVGVVARRGDKFSVVEYSEISSEQAERIDPKSGALAFRAGNIVNHFYTLGFLNEVESFEEQLAFHIARKKIPTVDLENGEQIKPSKPNGMKLEMFVFDVFPFTRQFSVLEVVRQEEFSPLKNAPGTGSDDPDTSRRDLLAQHKRFLQSAGAIVEDGVEIEISPLLSYAGEGLEGFTGKKFSESGIATTIKDLEKLAN